MLSTLSKTKNGSQLQLEHHNSNFIKKTFPIVLLCNNISNASNIGGILRLADAFGVSELVFIGQQKSFGHKVRKASRSTENHVDYKFIDDAEYKLETLKNENFKIVALEITENSLSINALKIEPKSKIALIVGNESEGINERYLNMADKIFHIELFGNNSSINVTTATAIALQKIVSDLNS